MAARIAWVLNLDADLELAVPAYTRKATVREAMRTYVPLVVRSLLAPGDLLVEDDSPPGFARGLPGRAFCPTPRALALLEFAGAIAEPHPPLDVVRRVNSRAFCASLGQTLPGAELVTAEARALAKIASGGPWRVKRLFGMTGKNQRVIDVIGDVDRGFVRTGIAEGGVQIEPNVVIEEEYGVHGMIGEDHRVELGRAVLQRCDARGAWLATEPLEGRAALVPLGASPARNFVARFACEGDEIPGLSQTSASLNDCSHFVPTALAAALADEGRRVAVALIAEGYFGPFGVDAFSYEGKLNPRSEINARYTMGFGVGFREATSP